MKPTRGQYCSEVPTRDCSRRPTTKPYDASGSN
jgi:hypothetical protein